MKKYLFLTLIMTSVLAVSSSCKKEYTCVCTETYEGEINPYTVKKETVLKDYTEEEAKVICAKGNVGPQSLLGETWGINCELK